MSEKLKTTEEWDKVFPQSEKVNHKKVTFKNHFGITLVADMYEPKQYEGKFLSVQENVDSEKNEIFKIK